MKKLPHLGFLACGILLSACNQAPTASLSDTASAAASTVSQSQAAPPSKVPANAPVVRVATTGTMPPFSLMDKYGNLTGYDIDVIRAIGEEEGFRIEFIKNSWQALFASVDSGKTDLAISGISYNPERAEKYALSNPYFFNPSAVMYKDTKFNIKSFGDLKPLRVGAMENTIQHEKIKTQNPADQVMATRSTYLLFQALVQNRVDAILQDYPLLKDTAKNHPEQKVYIVPYQDKNDPTAYQIIVMKKGNQALLAKINDGIKKMQADGTMKKIEDKWQISVDDAGTTPASLPASSAQ